MRRVVLLVVLALALPTAALANSIDYIGTGTSASGTASWTGTPSAGGTWGVTMSLTEINNNGSVSSATGMISITSGTLVSTGACAGSGTSCFSFTGGTVDITSGSSTLFAGTFTKGQVINFGTSVAFNGSLSNGLTVSGVLNFGEGGILANSSTAVSTVPEPGTLGLLGTGLVGLAGAVRRKFRS